MQWVYLHCCIHTQTISNTLSFWISSPLTINNRISMMEKIWSNSPLSPFKVCWVMHPQNGCFYNFSVQMEKTLIKLAGLCIVLWAPVYLMLCSGLYTVYVNAFTCHSIQIGNNVFCYASILLRTVSRIQARLLLGLKNKLITWYLLAGESDEVCEEITVANIEMNV